MENLKLSAEDTAALVKARKSQDDLVTSGYEKKQVHESQIENFLEIMGIPSRNVYYSEAITGQPLKVDDLLQLQTITPDNVYGRMGEIFTRRTRGIDPNNILLADETYIALWMRENSFPGYKFPHKAYKCKKCKTHVERKDAGFLFDALDFNSNIDTIREIYGEKDYIEFELPKSKRVVKQVLKKRNHVGTVQSVINRDYTQYGKKPTKEMRNLMNLVSNVYFGDESPTLQARLDIVRNLDAIDFIELLKNVNKNSLSSGIVVELTCPHCKGGISEKGYPFRTAIYFPID
jgi:hypothetical protein